MLCATKVRIYPTPEQAEFLGRQFGAVRFVYNKALAVKRHCYKVHSQKLSTMHDLKKLLPVAKKLRRYAWLADYDAMALQQACINLDKAFRNFFEGRARFPRFKRKHGEQKSYHCSGKIAVLEDSIMLPKMAGPIKGVIHRPVSGTLKSITVTRSATGKSFAALLFEDGKTKPEPAQVVPEEAIVGVDVGVINRATESNGRETPNPRFLKRALHNLRRKQKAVSRRKKGSRNRAEARLKVAAAHERLVHARHDFQHKLSRRLTDENQAVCVETLAVKNLLKNPNLAQAIADAASYSLIAKLTYKAERIGNHLVKIDWWTASSLTCSCCLQVKEELDLKERRWTCEGCGTEHDRDENAALNIRRAGIVELRAGGWHVPVCRGLRKTVHATAAASEAEILPA
ncbi:IS200/IS605 family element transposase accessory protein TnpB [Microvirga tunisiensis]|uniref:IS200/IS605 family element transposase accessory protein TnpB n=2 Tax=Microvirga tunisiensis TaxID=2108360 RepID=A0A5N7MR50_9HYPH|nr:RNA-guided endonuclease TnpB family protein [Microvirga tunisiensis]MPR08232.1 IS200/IS605 family element transposase accessory protein TnpB [Microvirga tunisiensis]MPR26466.1 IS200/IS605 family element transposase accessory protein TnpB [Microvirga tunisiensis]